MSALKIPIIILIFFSLLFSCTTKKVIITKKYIKKLTSNTLVDSLEENYGNLSTCNSKFKILFKQSNKTHSLSGTLKIERDSIIWISLNPGFGLEVARGIFKKDSFCFLERINTSYLKGSYAQIKNAFSIDIDYFMLQSIFLNTVSFYSLDTNTIKNLIIKKDNNGKNIEIENFGRRSVKKIEKNSQTTYPIYQKITVDNSTLKVSDVLVKDYREDRAMKIKYDEFVYVDSIKTYFPQTIDIKISQKLKDIDINIRFVKLQFNTQNEYPFDIPEKYSIMKYP